MTDSEPLVYARQLYAKKYGYPLYTPEPSSNSPYYLSTGVIIGDVGYVTWDGAFQTLFNVLFSASHPRNQIHGVPDDFIPLELAESAFVYHPGYHHQDSFITRRVAIKKSWESGVSVSDPLAALVGAGVGGIYARESNEGAFLHLPNGATRWECRLGLKKCQGYAIENARSWYQFAEEYLPRDDTCLYLVTGCDKASSWALGAFSNASSQHGAELEITASQSAGGRIKYDYRCTHEGSLQIRKSPLAQTSIVDAHQPSNEAPSDLFVPEAHHEPFSHLLPRHHESHCVFVRGFRVSVRPPSLFNLKGERVKIKSTESLPKHLEPGRSHSSSTNDLGGYSSTRGSPSPSSNKFSASGHRRTMDTACSDSASHLWEEDGDSVIVGTVPDILTDWDPAHDWIKHLFLQCPSATVAIVHDDDIFELAQTVDRVWVPGNAMVEKDGAVYLDLSRDSLRNSTLASLYSVMSVAGTYIMNTFRRLTFQHLTHVSINNISDNVSALSASGRTNKLFMEEGSRVPPRNADDDARPYNALQ